jgi:hypothetical protein
MTKQFMTKRFSEQDKKTIWDMREAGVPVKRIARHCRAVLPFG